MTAKKQPVLTRASGPTKQELEHLVKLVQADFDNYRKRVEQEKGQVIQFANANLLIDLLPVLDNFRRALAHRSLGEGGADDPWTQGILAIERQLEETLRQHGLTPIAVKPGDQFDANVHEAVSAEDKETGKLGTVSEILQQGYLLSGKVLRPAKVVVN